MAPRGSVTFSGRSWVPIEHKVALTEAYLIPSGTLIDPAIWPQHIWAKNCGAQPSFWEGELGPHLAQCGLERGPLPCQCHLDLTRRLATIDMGRKLGAPPPFWGGGWVPMIPYNTKSPGPRPTSIPSGILIHPAIWPQQTWAEIWGRLCPLFGEGSLVPIRRLPF